MPVVCAGWWRSVTNIIIFSTCGGGGILILIALIVIVNRQHEKAHALAMREIEARAREMDQSLLLTKPPASRVGFAGGGPTRKESLSTMGASSNRA